MSVRSIEKTLDTLDYFLRKDARHGIALKEICDELGYKKSAAHHMLSTICDKGYLYQDLKTKKYLLGSKFFKFTKLMPHSKSAFTNFSFSHLKKINDKTGEAVHLATFEGSKLITLKMIESKHPVRVDQGFLNKDNAFHATASGKAILAFLDKEKRKKILKNGLYKFTDKTHVSFNSLEQELHRIKKNGFAYDDEEFQEGVFCIGFPIFDNNGNPYASVSCSSPKFKIRDNKNYIEKIRVSVAASANEISKYFKQTKKKGEKHAA